MGKIDFWCFREHTLFYIRTNFMKAARFKFTKNNFEIH